MIKEDEETIVNNLINLLEKSIKKEAPKEKFGLLFSGGLDSSLIAFILKKLEHKFTCYTTEFYHPNFKKSEDVFYVKKLAKELNLKSKIIRIKNGETEDALRKVLKIIKSSEVTKISIALPLYFSFMKAKEDDCKTIFHGGGCDSIFAGFNRHKKAKDINKECHVSLQECLKKIETREKALAKHSNLKLITPFLDKEFVNYSLKIPGNYKIKENIEKYILRKVAMKLDLPEYIAKRKKKAIQYSSNCQKFLRKLTKKSGFKKIKDYLESLKDEKPTSS